MRDINLSNIRISPPWLDFLRDEFLSDYFADIKANYIKARSDGELIFPYSHLVFNAFNMTSLSDLKIVLLGQDPYHNAHMVSTKCVDSYLLPKGVANAESVLLPEAMGLSFSVPRVLRIPPSLQNIYMEMSHSLDFSVPTHGDLSNWCRRGMLLLNSILSVKARSPASHKHFGWERFTDRVIERISSAFDGLLFILLGKYAHSKEPLIDSSKHFILKAPHPSPLAKGFVGSGVFRKADEILKEHGVSFDWSL